MGRLRTEVNKELLRACIEAVEANGPLRNRHELYNKVSINYGKEKVTPSVVMLRIEEFGIVIKTPKGKKNYVPGQMPPVRKSRLESNKNNREAINALKQYVPPSFLTLVNKIAGGSTKACVKLMCLDCVGFQRKQQNTEGETVDLIGGCELITCPLWTVRPYQK